MADVDFANQSTSMNRQLGPYHIQEEIGAGAMGTVYRAVHTGLDRPVALKVLRSDMLQDADSVRRFLREARSSARLEHPHIVSVYDAGEIDGTYYIAMKLLEGDTLQTMLSGSGIAVERVVRLGTQLASALDYAHGRDVVHLDVKPANVIISGQDMATLTDFSIAQALNPGATRSATIAGTPLYMSPEQIQGKDLDSRSDIYSLGLLLFEMCVGHPPYQGQFVTVMYAHLHSPVPDISGPMPQVPEALAQVIYRSLAKDRAERFQTAGELLRALERAVPKDDEDETGTLRLGRDEVDTLLSNEAAQLAPNQLALEETKFAHAETSPSEGRDWGRFGLMVLGATATVVILILLLMVIQRSSTTTPARVPATVAASQTGPVLLVPRFFVSMSIPVGRVSGPIRGTSRSVLRTHSLTVVSQVRLSRTGIIRNRAVFHLRYVVYSSHGALLSRTSPPVFVLDRANPARKLVSSIALRPASQKIMRPGAYLIRMIVNGHPARSLHFTLTG